MYAVPQNCLVKIYQATYGILNDLEKLEKQKCFRSLGICMALNLMECRLKCGQNVNVIYLSYPERQFHEYYPGFFVLYILTLFKISGMYVTHMNK